MVSAEVTPHHLSMWLPVAEEPDPPALLKVNPPLRTERDRTALVRALREGVIEAVATDHAPHRAAEKSLAYDDAAPGMVGLRDGARNLHHASVAWAANGLPTLVERMTVGPHRILGPNSGVPEPRLRIGEAATCTLFDPSARVDGRRGGVALAVTQHAADRQPTLRGTRAADHRRRSRHPSGPGARAGGRGACRQCLSSADGSLSSRARCSRASCSVRRSTMRATARSCSTRA